MNLEQLRAAAAEKGLEVAEGATKAQIQAMLDELATTEDTGTEPVVEGDTPADVAAQDIETPSLPETEVKEFDEANHASAPAKAATSDISAAAEIGAAIAKGLADAKEDKKITINVDETITPRFSLVRDQSTGEVLTRENETGLLSQLQLKSLEEKDSDLQSRSVEEV